MELHLPDGNAFIDMLLSTNTAYLGATDAVIPDADDAKLMAALTALARGEIEYVVLADGECFLQAAGDARSGYVLEYNDGSTEHQSRAARQNLAGTEIADAFRRYLHRDAAWQTDFTWEKFEI
jgi:hypothetical protein